MLLATPAWVPVNEQDGRDKARVDARPAAWPDGRAGHPDRGVPGTRNKVFWFKATNRWPSAGEHPAMVQGVAIVGELAESGSRSCSTRATFPSGTWITEALGDAAPDRADPVAAPVGRAAPANCPLRRRVRYIPPRMEEPVVEVGAWRSATAPSPRSRAWTSTSVPGRSSRSSAPTARARRRSSRRRGALRPTSGAISVLGHDVVREYA